LAFKTVATRSYDVLKDPVESAKGHVSAKSHSIGNACRPKVAAEPSRLFAHLAIDELKSDNRLALRVCPIRGVNWLGDSETPVGPLWGRDD
jgi:hypothetical protein